MHIYRDHQYAALLGNDSDASDGELERGLASVRALYARAVAMTAAGMFGVVWLAVTVGCIVFSQRLSFALLLAFWAVVPFVYGVASLIARFSFCGSTRRDALTERIRRQENASALAMVDRLRRLGPHRFVWLLGVVAIAAPLSLHFVGGLGLGFSVSRLIDYAGLALIGSGIAHIYVVVAVARYGMALATGPIERPRWKGAKTALWASVAGAVPAAIYPPALLISMGAVLATGMLYLPALYWVAARIAQNERDVVKREGLPDLTPEDSLLGPVGPTPEVRSS